jgi:membrane-bound lytic murein transglycosylase MltF
VIAEEYARLQAKEAAVGKAEKAFHQHDPEFEAAGKHLPAGLTARDLKALIAQESGDLTIADVRGDKAGLAQMGKVEAKEIGMDPKNRLDPKKAIPGAAKVLAKKAAQLDAALVKQPKGDERRKFVYASYNAGARTIKVAQEEAIKQGLDPTVWANLTQGGAKSPLYKAIAKALPKLDPGKKLAETTGYVERILARQQ